MFLKKKKWDKEAVCVEAKKIISGIMKSYEREELGNQVETFFESIDSLRIIELIVLTEKKFKISFSPEQLSGLSEKKFDVFVDMIMQNV